MPKKGSKRTLKKKHVFRPSTKLNADTKFAIKTFRKYHREKIGKLPTLKNKELVAIVSASASDDTIPGKTRISIISDLRAANHKPEFILNKLGNDLVYEIYAE